ncbi:MAG: class I SAM-dependent methyltransferase [Bdellovibrionales bacterium]|nr:class I SAM-dependent methyltransferase [Bdellovibrionales bacterium]
MERTPVIRLKHVMDQVLRASPALSREVSERRRKRLFTGQRFRVGLERPSAFEVTDDTITVRGWVVSFDDVPVRGRIIIDEHVVEPIVVNRSRIDVAQSYSIDDESRAVGFEQQISWDRIGPRATQAQIRVEFQHGSDMHVLGPVQVERATAVAEQRLHCRIERPANDEVVAGPIEIRGWAFSRDEQPLSGQIYVDGSLWGPLTFNDDRPDVVCVHGLETTQPCGFRQIVQWAELGTERDSVTIRVDLCHGRELLSFGPYQVSRAEAPILKHQRGVYKAVWNGAASDVVSACASVAGTSDAVELEESGIRTAATIRDALEIDTDDEVLEIGCGIGRVGRFLAPQCGRWIGSDISGNMLSHAAEYLRGIPNVQLIELSTCSLREVADRSVDKVYCSTVFMHLDEWDRYRYVMEAFRVLRPGGKFYVDNLNLDGEVGWALFEENVSIDPAHRAPAISKPSTEEELKTYLKRAGFEKVTGRPGPHFVAVFGKKPLER